MYSYRHFTPGRKSTTSKIIHSDRSKVCMCDTYDKFTVLNNLPNISKGMRIAQTIRTSIGGTTRFGNNYISVTDNVLTNQTQQMRDLEQPQVVLPNIVQNKCVEWRAENCRTLQPPRNKF